LKPSPRVTGHQTLEAACIERVRERFLPALERIADKVLGERFGGDSSGFSWPFSTWRKVFGLTN